MLLATPYLVHPLCYYCISQPIVAIHCVFPILQVEKVMFEAAHSREEYYKLLAQKIYLIRKELEDRKRGKKTGKCLCLPTLLIDYLCLPWEFCE